MFPLEYTTLTEGSFIVIQRTGESTNVSQPWTARESGAACYYSINTYSESLSYNPSTGVLTFKQPYINESSNFTYGVVNNYIPIPCSVYKLSADLPTD